MQPVENQNPLAESAKGWHNIQLAVMGFIGLCGMLRMGETMNGPQWLGLWSAVMWVLALVTSVVSTLMVGSVAFPFYGGQAAQAGGDLGDKLRNGIRMTFASIGMIALSAATAWWPAGQSGGMVEVTDARGATACGTWVSGAPEGVLWLETADGRLSITISQLSRMDPVAGC